MDDAYMGQLQDAILGQDFLTWLWFKSETRGGEFKGPDGAPFNLHLEQKIAVQGGEGETTETTQVSGLLSELREARMGLAMGKKVTKANLRIEQDPDVWQLNISAQDMTFTGVKTPKVDTKQEEGDDPDSAFLEKMYLIEKVVGFMDAAYAEFLRLRLGPEWDGERKAVSDWLKGSQA
jgi:hypothetical protein